jgi:Phage integrase, N-terminal SAM-like domain
MTPLRQRMIEDMQLRGFSARTQECYAAAVGQLAKHYHRSPEQLTEEDLRQYFLYLANEKKVARATATIAGIFGLIELVGLTSQASAARRRFWRRRKDEQCLSPSLVAASRQQLKRAGETWTNTDCAEISAICRQNAVHLSSLSNGDDGPIDQS